MPKDFRFAPDYYDRLGLAMAADVREIRQRFRQLARLYHPDINPAPQAHERFLALQVAYDTLSDAEQRQRYDSWLAQEQQRLHPLLLRQCLGPVAARRDIGRQRLYLLLDLSAPSATEGSHPPLNIALVLDRSSSMRGERLLQVRSAARALAEQLGSRDAFSIVTFNDRAQVILPAGRGTPLHVVRGALEGIEPAGGTEIAQGLAAGLAQVRMAHGVGTLSHVILLTDGQTYGDEAQCHELARQAAADEIGISALGIGSDWNDRFLDALTSLARGRAHFIAEPSQAVALFERQLRQIQHAVAGEARLSLQLDPSIELLAAYEVAPDLRRVEGQRESIDVGALPSDPPLRLLVELALTPASRDVLLLGEMTLTARLRQSGLTASVTQPLLISQTDEAVTFPDPIVSAAQHAATLRLQERAWQAVAVGDVPAARRDLHYLATRFLEMGEVALAQATRAEMEGLQRTGQLSATGAKVIKYGTRMLALPASGTNGSGA